MKVIKHYETRPKFIIYPKELSTLTAGYRRFIFKASFYCRKALKGTKRVRSRSRTSRICQKHAKWLLIGRQTFLMTVTQNLEGICLLATLPTLLSHASDWFASVLFKSCLTSCTENLTYGHSSGNIQDKKASIADIETGKSAFKTLEMKNQKITLSGDVALVRNHFSAQKQKNGKSLLIGRQAFRF